jgi:hypothetical protein
MSTFPLAFLLLAALAPGPAAAPPALPVVWERPAPAAWAVGVYPAEGAVVFRAADGALVRLDGHTGAAVWTLPAPVDGAWDRAVFGRDAVALQGAAAGGAPRAALVGLTDGQPRWDRELPAAGRLEPGGDGAGLLLQRDRPPGTLALDPGSGAALTPWFPGQAVDRHALVRFDGAGERLEAVDVSGWRSTVHALDVRAGATLLAWDEERAAFLGAFRPAAAGAAAAPAWREPMGGDAAAAVGLLPAEGVAWSRVDGALRLVGLLPGAAGVAWRRTLPATPPACDGWDDPFPAVRSVPGPASGQATVLAQRCGTAVALDPATGAERWRVAADGLVVVVGEQAEGRATLRDVPLTRPPRHVRWVAPDGTPRARLALTCAPCAVAPTAGGLLERGEGGLALRAPDGAPRWEAPGPVRDAFLAGPLVLAWPREGPGVVRAAATGRVLGRLPAAPYFHGVLPAAGGAPAVAVFGDRDPARVLAVALPDPDEP